MDLQVSRDGGSAPVAPNAFPSGLTLGLGLFAAAFLAAAFVYGESARAAAERDRSSAAAAESRAFCGSLGLDSGADAYARCVDGLVAIRRRVEQRDAAQASGAI